MQPRFSVIIPAFNAEATLARAIESALTQSYRPFEVIVVNDGSTDSTTDVAHQFAPHVTLLVQENAGVSAARNAGVKHSSGDWIAFLDADDWYFPHRLREHVKMIESDDSIQMLTGDYEYVDQHSKVIGTSMDAHPSGRVLLERCPPGSSVMVDDDYEIELFVAEHFGDSHTLSNRKAVFEQVGGYPLGFRVCEDVHFLIRLVAKCRRFGVSVVTLGAYFIHGESATRRDRVSAQRENVRTLKDLMASINLFPPAVQRGLRTRIRRARYDLAASLLKEHRRIEAISAMAPALLESPGMESARYLLSIVKG